MAAPVSLEELKIQCRVDGNTEDAILSLYLSAATGSVSDYLNVTTPLDDTAAPAVKAAILLQAAGLHMQREDVSERPMQLVETYYRLLGPHREQTF